MRQRKRTRRVRLAAVTAFARVGAEGRVGGGGTRRQFTMYSVVDGRVFSIFDTNSGNGREGT